MRDWRAAKVSPEDSLLKTMAVINQTTYGMALVVDEQDHLLGAVVDGDIRRAVLGNMSLDTPLEKVMKRNPVTAPQGHAAEVYLDLMLSNNIQQLPLLGEEGKVLGIVLLKDLHAELAGGLKAVIMAGGLGTRLQPLTNSQPKPMLSVGEKPIMEHVLDRLRKSGIREVVVSTHYKSELIQDRFSDGASCGLEINYTREEHRLGTIGSLRLLRNQLREPFLVVNGDVLTTLDFSAIHHFHHAQKADMTIAVKKQSFHVPYGVVKVEREWVLGLEEKPSFSMFINAGIYLINPDVIELIPDGVAFDAPELIDKLISLRMRVSAFPVLEYWIDIGKPADYEKANTDMSEGRIV